MFFRTRRSFLALLTLTSLAAGFLRAEDANSDAAEAERLYSRANDYVSHITEKDYSYAYMQFYWKRAQSNLDRIARVYPKTPTGRKVRAEEVKIGPFELTYFKERVLPRLEEKRIAAFDPVNCSIFLYTLQEDRWDKTRLDAFQSIIEVLSRQQRWNEALSYPILDEYRPLLFTSVFRVAARYQQHKVVDQLIADATPEVKALYWPILGEAMALRGDNREDIALFLDEHAEPAVRLAVLSGMVDREIGIQRAALLRMKTDNGIPLTHEALLNLQVRDNIESVAKTFFPKPTPESDALVARYRAAIGQRPGSHASLDEHLAYLEHLAVADKIDDLAQYPVGRLSAADRQACELKMIELFARAGRNDRAADLFARHTAPGSKTADAALQARFRGMSEAFVDPITVRQQTFSGLGIHDPCVMAKTIMDWALTPKRSIRGASPWDSVVQQFLPGFDNLPLPKSKDVQKAASTSKPF